MTVELAFPYHTVKDLLVYSKKLGYLIPTDDVKRQMKAHGYVFEKHWDIGFREWLSGDVLFVFVDNQAAMTFSMHFQ